MITTITRSLYIVGDDYNKLNSIFFVIVNLFRKKKKKKLFDLKFRRFVCFVIAKELCLSREYTQ